MPAPATPPTTLELNYHRWLGRLAAAERQLRTRQLEAKALYPASLARQQAHYARQLAQRERLAVAAAQARTWVEAATSGGSEPAPSWWRRWLKGRG